MIYYVILYYIILYYINNTSNNNDITNELVVIPYERQESLQHIAVLLQR